MEFLKSTTGKVVSALLALGVIAAGIAWWQAEPETRAMIITGTGRIIGWFAVVLALPWVSFPLIGRIARMESNAAGAALVASYTLAEMVLLAWLFNWGVAGASGWTFFLAAGLIAGVYNLFTCDWLAEKVA